MIQRVSVLNTQFADVAPKRQNPPHLALRAHSRTKA